MTLIPSQSAKELDGYFWTVADGRKSYCTSCDKNQLTYCQEALSGACYGIYCCVCQREIELIAK